MLWKLILLLTVVPIVEFWVLMELKDWTSFSFTVLVVLGTGVVGAILARMEGLRTLRRIRDELGEGRIPGDSLLDGAMILVAGALLVTPGVLTDAAGFLLLAPPSRSLLRRALKHWIKGKMDGGEVFFHKRMGFGPISQEPPPGSPPMEGEDSPGQ